MTIQLVSTCDDYMWDKMNIVILYIYIWDHYRKHYTEHGQYYHILLLLLYYYYICGIISHNIIQGYGLKMIMYLE
jgi:hypothetical protein